MYVETPPIWSAYHATLAPFYAGHLAFHDNHADNLMQLGFLKRHRFEFIWISSVRSVCLFDLTDEGSEKKSGGRMIVLCTLCKECGNK